MLAAQRNGGGPGAAPRPAGLRRAAPGGLRGWPRTAGVGARPRAEAAGAEASPGAPRSPPAGAGLGTRPAAAVRRCPALARPGGAGTEPGARGASGWVWLLCGEDARDMEATEKRFVNRDLFP